jgi:hypothetical protein
MERKDATTAYQEWQARQRSEAELREHQFTMAEVADLQHAAATGDPEAVQSLEALAPFIAASNQRGDFRYPHQMSRKEYGEHIGADGEPVYSLPDLAALQHASGQQNYETLNSPLATAWREELNGAQREGRLMQGPRDQRGHHTAIHFAGEDNDSAERTKHLEYLDTAMQASVNIRQLIRESLDKVKEHRKNGTDKDTVMAYISEKGRQVAGSTLAFEADGPRPFSPRTYGEFDDFGRIVCEYGYTNIWAPFTE